MVGTVNQRGKIDVPPPQSPGQSRIELCLVFVSFVKITHILLSSRFEFHGGWGGGGWVLVVCKVFFVSNPTSFEQIYQQIKTHDISLWNYIY